MALGASVSCNIIFQSAIKIDIARNQSAIFVLSYAYSSFKLNNLIVQRFPFPGFTTNHWVIVNF